MKAAWVEQYGGIDCIQVGEFPLPIRQSGEVLIQMKASTINHHDIYLRRGEISKTKLPVILGSDGAGVVVAADSASRFKANDHVVIYPVLVCGTCCSCVANLPHQCLHFGMIGGEQHGTHAEYVSVPEACVVSMPKNLDFDEAAALSLAGLTAWNMVMEESMSHPGEHALVLGASGGVGIFTVMLLKKLGVNVHAITSSPQKRTALFELGVDTVLDDAPAQVLRFTRTLPNKGVDIAFNFVGGNTWRYIPPAVRAGGSIMICGSVRSPVAEIDMRQIFYRNITLKGCTMGTPAALQAFLNLAAEEEKIHLSIDQVIGLEEIPMAHRQMEEQKVFGKIIIRNGE